MNTCSRSALGGRAARLAADLFGALTGSPCLERWHLPAVVAIRQIRPMTPGEVVAFRAPLTPAPRDLLGIELGRRVARERTVPPVAVRQLERWERPPVLARVVDRGGRLALRARPAPAAQPETRRLRVREVRLGAAGVGVRLREEPAERVVREAVASARRLLRPRPCNRRLTSPGRR